MPLSGALAPHCPKYGSGRGAGAGAGRFELIELLQRGCGAAPQFNVGLRRRNNEFNELTNCCAARLWGIAPERGAYSRIGACPYLPPQLINSRCCPCKGRISWAGLAPQQDSRYEPLTGARFINRPQEVGASPYPGICAPFRGAGAALSEIWFRQRRWRWRRQVRINRIIATGLWGCAAIQCWPQTA